MAEEQCEPYAQRQSDEEQPHGRAWVVTQDTATDVGGVDEEQHREDHLGDVLGESGIEGVCKRAVCGVFDDGTGEHQKQRRGDAPSLQPPGSQGPAGQDDRDRDH
jgi:hypothetical protein